MSEFTQDPFAFDKDAARALEFCTYCPRLCHFACPTAHGDASESATPWGMMTLTNMARRGELALSDDLAEALERCSSCGRCTDFCRHENPVADILQIARSTLQQHGHHGTASRVLAEEAQSANVGPPVAGMAFLPCETSSRSDLTALASTLSRVTGRDVSVASYDGPCLCVLERAGLAEAAEALAERLGAHVSGADTLVTECGRAARIAAEGQTVIPLITLLDHHVDQLAALAADKAPLEVVLHGGCRERRPTDHAAAERSWLQSVGVTAIDAYAVGGSQECCGGDGVYNRASPLGAARAASAVVDGARPPGTDAEIITTSARCSAHFARSGVPVRSLIDLLIERVGS